MDQDKLHVRYLKGGNVSSFEHLYRVWGGKLYNFVMRISNGDSYLAEEIVQSVFIKIWENRETLDPEKSFGAYLCTIAKNDLTTIYQRRMLEYVYQEKMMQNSLTEENDTEREVEYRMLDEYVNSLIEQLPPARREIFRLSRKQQLSNREIAELLHLSENTVESQLTKASAFLREKVAIHYNLSIALFVYLFSVNID